MSHSLLLPNRYKKIGWILLVPATIMGIVLLLTEYEGLSIHATVFALFNEAFFTSNQNFQLITTNITNTLVGIVFIVGAVFVGFSREKKEDEFIANIRLTSLVWAVYVNYVLLLLSFIFIYGMAFLHVMIYNMFTVLIIFIGRFNYILYKNSKSVSDEK
jgi:hypothetical protein